ncbi:MAG: orotidine-5'-phosphate decarboxylase [Clostridia bacterium]|nr:orotidine-5'-phosphate decarboxylase [Clostridia bacterium]
MIDKLIDRIKETNNPTVIGLDPRYDIIPDCVKSKYSKDLEGYAKASIEFCKALVDTTYDIIPAVKLQLAYFEMLGPEGLKAFKEIKEYAESKNMIIMADAKRGDIGSTSQGYSNAFLGETPMGDDTKKVYDVDFITLNPYMGTDCVKPFIDDSKKYNKGVFILVKTSNKSSGELQDLKLENGKKVYEQVTDLVEHWGEDLRGKYGYSSVAAVVGATYPEQLKEIRKMAPHTFFLIPGYGAQGGKAEDIALAFDQNKLGGIVNATRSLMLAYKSDKWKDIYSEEQYAEATRAEAIRMRDELNKALDEK